MAKTQKPQPIDDDNDEQEQVFGAPEDELEESDESPTWFDEWSDIFKESITALLGNHDGVSRIDVEETISMARDLANRALQELQYKEASMLVDETQEASATAEESAEE